MPLNGNTQNEPKPSDRVQAPLDEQTAEVLTRIYVARRLQYQMSYYRSKIELFEEREDVAFRAGAIIMVLTSLLAALGTQTGAPSEISLLTAVLPALAAVVSSFKQLYQWERQAGLFHDTKLGLERASLTLPDLDQVDKTIAAKVFPQLVGEGEKVFEDEVSQWGQIAVGESKEKEQQDSLLAFANDYGIDIYDADGNLDESKLAQIKGILQVSQGSPEVKSPNLSVSYPEMAAGITDENALSAIPKTIEEFEEANVDDDSPDKNANSTADEADNI